MMYLPKYKTPFLKGKSTQHGPQTIHEIKERKGVSGLIDEISQSQVWRACTFLLGCTKISEVHFHMTYPQTPNLTGSSIFPKSLSTQTKAKVTLLPFPTMDLTLHRWPGGATDCERKAGLKQYCSTSSFFHESSVSKMRAILFCFCNPLPVRRAHPSFLGISSLCR